MKEINFFNEFLKEKVKAVGSLIRTGIITLFIGILLIGGYAYLEMEYNTVNVEAIELEFALNDVMLARKKAEVIDEEGKLKALNNYLTALKEVDKRINYLHNLTADENYKILNAFPIGTYLESFEVNEMDLTLVGHALTVDLVPAIVQNLSDTGIFTTVYAPQTKWTEIKEEDPLWVLTNGGIIVSDLKGLYSFQIECRFNTERSEQD